MALSRRQLLAGAGAAALLAAGGFTAWRMTAQDEPTLTAQAQAGDGPQGLMEPGPLGEMTIGEDDAPVTVIEYASMTCGHCATFHNETWPRIKSEYIDTGQVRFLFREFPLDPVATAAFMLARCVSEDRYFPFVEAMFARQREWAYAENVEDGLFQMARQAGFNRPRFEECLTNQDILDGVNAVRERAASEFDVGSTPTFFINGEVVRGAVSFEQFEEIVQRHLDA